MDPVSLVVLVVSLGAIGVVSGRRYLRTRKALLEPITGDECVACRSRSVTTFGSECYRCDVCRFEWGDGLVARAALERKAALERLPRAERRSLAAAELAQAEARLVAAEAALGHASDQLVPDLVFGGGSSMAFGADMYSRARNEGVVVATRELTLVRRHLRRAAEAMEWGPGHDGPDADVVREVIGLDAHLDTILTDIAGHLQVGMLREQAAELRKRLLAARQALQAQSAS
jgi:hypothetical protein